MNIFGGAQPNDSLMRKLAGAPSLFLCGLTASMLLASLPAAAEGASADGGQGATEGKAAADVHDAQNPIANVISIPLQNNFYTDYGPYKRDANILVIQPVLPLTISSDWNLITRWVTPLIATPPVSPSQGAKFGLGNMEPEFYFSPSHVGEVIWGIGPKLFLPTETDKTLGQNKWGAGPTAVALTIQGHWVVGALANNLWAGSATQKVNQLTVNPFVNYNLTEGWYLASAEIITANWVAKPGEKWTVPIGGGVGRLFHIGSLPINARFQALNNVVRPLGVPDWDFQFQVQFLFKK